MKQDDNPFNLPKNRLHNGDEADGAAAIYSRTTPKSSKRKKKQRFSATGEIEGKAMRITGTVGDPDTGELETNFSRNLPYRGLTRTEEYVTPAQFALVTTLLENIPYHEPGESDLPGIDQAKWDAYAKRHNSTIQRVVDAIFGSPESRQFHQGVASTNIAEKRAELDSKNYRPPASAQPVVDCSEALLESHITLALLPFFKRYETLEVRSAQYGELIKILRRLNYRSHGLLKRIEPKLFEPEEPL